MSHAKVRLEMSKQFKFSETLKETQIKGSFANLIKKRKEAITIKGKKTIKRNEMMMMLMILQMMNLNIIIMKMLTTVF